MFSDIVFFSVQVNASIDNINLEDAIRLNAPAEFKSLNAFDMIVQNITVAERINRCNLSSVSLFLKYQNDSFKSV